MPGCKVGDRAIIIPGTHVYEHNNHRFTIKVLEEIVGLVVNVVAPAQTMMGLKMFRIQRVDQRSLPVMELDVFGNTTDRRLADFTPAFWDKFLDPIRGKPEEKKIGDPLAEARKQYQKDLILTRLALEKFPK